MLTVQCQSPTFTHTALQCVCLCCGNDWTQEQTVTVKSALVGYWFTSFQDHVSAPSHREIFIDRRFLGASVSQHCGPLLCSPELPVSYRLRSYNRFTTYLLVWLNKCVRFYNCFLCSFCYLLRFHCIEPPPPRPPFTISFLFIFPRFCLNSRNITLLIYFLLYWCYSNMCFYVTYNVKIKSRWIVKEVK